jgi:enoyl-[acyl-carrier-protein] reductase (NADH)
LPGCGDYTTDGKKHERRISGFNHYRSIPLGRMCNIEELGKVACFIASDRAAMITGQTLAVDGCLPVSGRPASHPAEAYERNESRT